MRRSFDSDRPELMDQAKLVNGKPTPELERDLANLSWLNLRFGAVLILHRFLERWLVSTTPKSTVLRVLDLATGEADLPRELILWCRKRQIAVAVDAVEANNAVLAVARCRSAGFPELTFHKGDIRSWGSGKWDLVLCSLALHHFNDHDAVDVLRNARRLAVRHLLVADLERCIIGVVGIWLLTAFFLREPMTVHDARLSIRRSFSYHEFAKLAQEAGWEDFSHARFPFTRQAIWID